MGKKKSKNKPVVDIEVETSGGPPADPSVPDLPTPKVNVHVSSNNTNQNANANANVNGNAVVDGKNPSIHLHHDHAHNHHHSHYARSVDRDSSGAERVRETKETVDSGGGKGTTVVETTKTTSLPAPSSVKVPTVKALSIAAPPPGSPLGSVKALSASGGQQRPPDVIVNIALPPQAAPAPAPVPVVPSLPPPSPLAVPTVIPLPPSMFPSPAPSIRSLKPIKASKTANSAVRVTAVPIPEEPEEMEETTVVTTTTTRRKAGTPPKVPSPRLAAPAPLPPPGTPLVVSDPTFLPVPDPLPRASSIGSHRHRGYDDVIERTVTETVSIPMNKEKEKGSFFDKLKNIIKPTDTGSPPNKTVTPPAGDGHITVHVHGGKGGGVDVDVDTAATTIGGPTTKGIGGARTAALGSVISTPPATKAGLKPIPIIDYKALITQTPPRRRPTLPPEPAIVRSPPPAAPKTMWTMSADLDHDSKGGQHLHTRVRDHTNVVKPEKVVAKKPSKEEAAAGGGGVDVSVNVDGQQVDIALDQGIETKKEKKEREKRERKEMKEPPYKPLRGAYPPPMSERYAMPPALEDIQNAARERYERRAAPGGMGIPGMGHTMYGPPFAPPMPATMPRPPPFMGQRPPMFGGNFPPYPMPGMGMPVNNSMMGMGMGGMGYGMGMPGWNGAGYGWMGNPRFPKRPGSM